MAKKKAKAKSTARTTRALSKKTLTKIKKSVPVDLWIDTSAIKEDKYDKKKFIASLIRYRIQDDGINPVNDADLDDLERWIINLLDGYYD